MSLTLKGGLLIGLSCAAWMYIVGFTGWYRDPALQAMFFLVIFIEVGILFWMLRRLPETGKTFAGILKAGTYMSLIAAVVIFAASYLFTTAAFPHYFEEVRTLGIDTYRAQGLTEDEIKSAMAAIAPMQTPVVNALTGAIMTVVTGFLGSAVIALILKKKAA